MIIQTMKNPDLWIDVTTMGESLRIRPPLPGMKVRLPFDEGYVLGDYKHNDLEMTHG